MDNAHVGAQLGVPGFIRPLHFHSQCDMRKAHRQVQQPLLLLVQSIELLVVKQVKRRVNQGSGGFIESLALFSRAITAPGGTLCSSGKRKAINKRFQRFKARGQRMCHFQIPFFQTIATRAVITNCSSRVSKFKVQANKPSRRNTRKCSRRKRSVISSCDISGATLLAKTRGPMIAADSIMVQ